MVTQKKELLKKLIRPIFSQGQINMNIKRYITNIDGDILTGAAIPAVMRKDYPVFMLGNFDRLGGFNISKKTVPQPPALFFLCTYVQGVNQPLAFATGFNTVQNNLRDGDIVTVWVDDFNNPSYYAFIVQTVQNGGLASLISNPDNEKIEIANVSIQTDNEQQLNMSWQIVWCDNRGNFKTNPFNVGSIYRPPYFKLTDFLEINISFELSHYMGLNFLLRYATQELNINFRVNN